MGLCLQEVGEGRYNWLATKAPYSCVIASPKKEAKFKGLKSFIAYQLTPSVSVADFITYLYLKYLPVPVSR